MDKIGKIIIAIADLLAIYSIVMFFHFSYLYFTDISTQAQIEYGLGIGLAVTYGVLPALIAFILSLIMRHKIDRTFKYFSISLLPIWALSFGIVYWLSNTR